VTLPPSDAQSSRLLPHHPKRQLRPVPPGSATIPTSSIPAQLPRTPQFTMPPSPLSPIGRSDKIDHSDEIDHDDRAIDFASHSWNLATGGLKTLTAKHELPSLLERHAIEQQLTKSTYAPDSASVPRSYLFLLIILVCLVIMLISGSIVLFVMLQP
jgi:hypothetical protein